MVKNERRIVSKGGYRWPMSRSQITNVMGRVALNECATLGSRPPSHAHRAVPHSGKVAARMGDKGHGPSAITPQWGPPDTLYY
ncbi:unnamed protein product, partial [Iphiclides podalirius]